MFKSQGKKQNDFKLFHLMEEQQKDTNWPDRVLLEGACKRQETPRRQYSLWLLHETEKIKQTENEHLTKNKLNASHFLQTPFLSLLGFPSCFSAGLLTGLTLELWPPQRLLLIVTYRLMTSALSQWLIWFEVLGLLLLFFAALNALYQSRVRHGIGKAHLPTDHSSVRYLWGTA